MKTGFMEAIGQVSVVDTVYMCSSELALSAVGITRAVTFLGV